MQNQQHDSVEIEPLSNIHYSSCDDSESDDSESNSIRTVEMLSDLDEENIVEMDVDPFPLEKNMKRKFEMTTAMRDNKENDQTLKNYDKINK